MDRWRAHREDRPASHILVGAPKSMLHYSHRAPILGASAKELINGKYRRSRDQAVVAEEAPATPFEPSGEPVQCDQASDEAKRHTHQAWQEQVGDIAPQREASGVCLEQSVA